MEIRKLNTLRGIAALIVVISHYSNSTNILNGVLGNGAGQFGVMIFFILSGFLMSYLYMGKAFNHSEVRKFATARIARVVPLFLVIVLASYALQLSGVKGVLYPVLNEASLVSHITLLSGTSVLWTIPAEIHFYIVFVFLWWLFSINKRHLYAVLALVFLILVFLDFPRPKGRVFGAPFDISLIPSLPYFFVGAILGQLYGRWTPPTYLIKNIFVLVLLLIPLLYPQIFSLLTGFEHDMWQDVRVLVSVSIVFFVLVFLVPNSNVVLTNRVGDFLGKISYSLYLLHLPVLWQLQDLAKEQPTLFLFIYLASALGASYLSYLLIESPSRRAIRATTEM